MIAQANSSIRSSRAPERSGLRTVVANVEKDALNYSSGVIFEYYFSGRRARSQRLRRAPGRLQRCPLPPYKLLDPVNTYPLGNLACVNQGAGTDVVIEPELYELLRDALVRTEEGFGFSVSPARSTLPGTRYCCLRTRFPSTR